MEVMRVSGENLKIEGQGFTVNYDDFGPVYAPPVIFIHGFPFNKNIWSLQLELLKSNYRVIAYDIRGHGRSGSGDSPLSIDLFVDDLLHFIDGLELDKVLVCGLSLGGYIALNAIQKYPERFNALILCSTQCPADSEKVREGREKKAELVVNKGIEAYADESIRSLFAPTSFTARKEEVRSVRKMIVNNTPSFIQKGLVALAERKETCSTLSSIPVPVLILVGKDDTITPPSEAEYLNYNIRGSEMHVLPYAGHLANLENTHEFNDKLKKFIDRVCKTQHLSKHCEEIQK
ncbi:MAG: alpha/beta fold hydrolase [Bacteroidetes bacterium]|nr:alpha/beta fold hydrolase [Bacteroidota bacterium]